MKKLLLAFLVSILCISCFQNELEKQEKDKENLKYQVWNISKNFVSKNLKSPSTADFHLYEADINRTVSGSVIGKDTTYVVRGSFDAQNSFGAIIRSEFECYLSSKNGNYTLLDLRIK